MDNLLQNEHFWIYICFFLFIGIFGRTIYKYFKQFLEHQINNIKSEIVDSEELLDHSRTKLKNKRHELQQLEKKIAEIEKLAKETASNLSETFFDNLAIKEQTIKEAFKAYLEVEEKISLKRLENNLINSSFAVANNILTGALSDKQKQNVLSTAISNIPQILAQLPVRKQV